MKKICGVTIIYNPNDEVYSNICSYKDLLDKLYVIDNSEVKNNNLIAKLKQNTNIVYIDMNGNHGIAMAQKIGIDSAIELEYDFCLTMDQDSFFPFQKYSEISKYLEDPKSDDYGIIGLNFDKRYCVNGLVDVHDIISSGNFINLKNYKLIKGINPDLFIDWVDFDLCEQFHSIGKKTGMIGDIYINHSIGNPVKFKLFGKTYYSMNHSPIRYYYRYRNSIYLYRKNKKFYKKYYLKSIFVDIPKIIIFENKKFQKFKMIYKGRKDGRKGKLGKYNKD